MCNCMYLGSDSSASFMLCVAFRQHSDAEIMRKKQLAAAEKKKAAEAAAAAGGAATGGGKKGKDKN